MQINMKGIWECCLTARRHGNMNDQAAEWFSKIWVKHAALSPEFNARAFHDPIPGQFNTGYRYLVMDYQVEYHGYHDNDPERTVMVKFTVEDLRSRPMVTQPRTLLAGGYLDFDPQRTTLELTLPVTMNQLKYMRKDGVVFVDTYSALTEIQDLLDWMNNVPGAIPKDVTRLGYHQARTESHAWHIRTAAKRSAKLVAKDAEQQELGQIVIEPELFRDPGTEPLRIPLIVYEMLNETALALEGGRMANCMANYCDHLVYGRSRFFSLVGPSKDQSYSMQTDLTLTKVQQVRGFANRVLPPWEQNVLYAELDKLGVGFALTAPPLAKVKKA